MKGEENSSISDSFACFYIKTILRNKRKML